MGNEEDQVEILVYLSQKMKKSKLYKMLLQKHCEKLPYFKKFTQKLTSENSLNFFKLLNIQSVNIIFLKEKTVYISFFSICIFLNDSLHKIFLFYNFLGHSLPFYSYILFFYMIYCYINANIYLNFLLKRFVFE